MSNALSAVTGFTADDLIRIDRAMMELATDPKSRVRRVKLAGTDIETEPMTINQLAELRKVVLGALDRASGPRMSATVVRFR